MQQSPVPFRAFHFKICRSTVSRNFFDNLKFDGKKAETAALHEYVFLWPSAQERPTRERHNYLFTWGELRDRHYSPFCSASPAGRTRSLWKKARNCIKKLFCDKNKQRVLSDKKGCLEQGRSHISYNAGDRKRKSIKDFRQTPLALLKKKAAWRWAVLNTFHKVYLGSTTTKGRN